MKVLIFSQEGEGFYFYRNKAKWKQLINEYNDESIVWESSDALDHNRIYDRLMQEITMNYDIIIVEGHRAF